MQAGKKLDIYLGISWLAILVQDIYVYATGGTPSISATICPTAILAIKCLFDGFTD